MLQGDERPGAWIPAFPPPSPLSSWPGLTHACPAQFMLERAHGIDSTRFQLFPRHLDTKGSKAVPHQIIVLHELTKYLPWGVHDRLVEEHGGDDPRALSSKAHLTGMLYGQFANAQSLREIEAALRSHAGKLYHLGARPVSRSTLAEANASRPVEIFGGVLEALMKQLQRGARRKVGDCLRLIDSTSVRLNSFSRDWAAFSAGVCGAKAHIVYDPDAAQPLYLQITKASVNDITAAKDMPIEAGASYVFDLAYYDYSWWAGLHRAGCRIVTRLKTNTPFEAAEERAVPANSAILSDRTGYLPKRLAGSRQNPLPDLVREVQVRIETGKVLRLFTNDLNASAEDIADLYKRRWEIELFFRWIKQTLKIKRFLGTSENAVRTQITVALIAFMLLRLAHEANKIVESLLTFTRLVRANLMQRRTIRDLLQPTPPPQQPPQPLLDLWPDLPRMAAA
jgi:hypothetical protein